MCKDTIIVLHLYANKLPWIAVVAYSIISSYIGVGVVNNEWEINQNSIILLTYFV